FQARPPRIFRFQGTAEYPQRSWHNHRVDPARRAFGRRSTLAECRRRSAGGGVLMSRIGKRPVVMPSGVTANIENGTLSVKGPKVSLSMGPSDLIDDKVEDGSIAVNPANDSRQARSFWGMQRTLVSNLVEGVTDGFSKVLEISGVGYRAQAQGNRLKLQLGYS